jgi:hypothetical protein
MDDNFISLFIIPHFTATAPPPDLSHLYYVSHVLTTFTNAGHSVYLARSKLLSTPPSLHRSGD